jgi:hypothetical protein
MYYTESTGCDSDLVSILSSEELAQGINGGNFDVTNMGSSSLMKVQVDQLNSRPVSNSVLQSISYGLVSFLTNC